MLLLRKFIDIPQIVLTYILHNEYVGFDFVMSNTVLYNSSTFGIDNMRLKYVRKNFRTVVWYQGAFAFKEVITDNFIFRDDSRVKYINIHSNGKDICYIVINRLLNVKDAVQRYKKATININENNKSNCVLI